MNHYVYIITNLINRKKYIGKRSCGCPIDQDTYMGSGVALKNAQKKYGIENFTKHILMICETEEQAFQEEEKAINLVKAWKNPQYYNMKGGGKGGMNGIRHSIDTKEKLRIINTGKKLSYEVRKKISASVGKGENSPVSKKVVLLNTKEFFITISEAEQRFNISGNTISKCCKGKLKSAGKLNGKPLVWRYYEDYKKMTINDINTALNIAVSMGKGSKNNNSKGVVLLNTLEIFNYMTLAHEKYGVDISHIVKCCKGKAKSAGKHPETGEKLVWQYLEDYEKNKKDAI